MLRTYWCFSTATYFLKNIAVITTLLLITMLYGNIIIEKGWKIEKGDKSWNNNYNYYSINNIINKFLRKKFYQKSNNRKGRLLNIKKY